MPNKNINLRIDPHLKECGYAAFEGLPVRHSGELVDGHVGLGTHVHAPEEQGCTIAHTGKQKSE